MISNGVMMMMMMMKDDECINGTSGWKRAVFVIAIRCATTPNILYNENVI